MNQNPMTVSYSLEEILGKINQKLDLLQKDVTDIKISQVRLDAELMGKMERLETELTLKMDRLETELTVKMDRLETALTTKVDKVQTNLTGRVDTLEATIKGEIKTLDAEVKAIAKRLDSQEYINLSVIAGLILVLVAGVIKLYFPNIPPN